MKLTTFETRTANVSRNSMGYKLAKSLLTKGGSVRPCWTSGSGRFTKNMDYTGDVIRTLMNAGLIEGKDFVLTNDADRGGKTGNVITLLNNRKKITQ